jgi:hypothetical protein
MKRRLVVSLVGLAISFALPTYAQENEPTLSEQEQAEKTARSGGQGDPAPIR